MKIYSLVKNGKRIDLTQEEFEKMIKNIKLSKGGPGSGRYPAGSGKEREVKERVDLARSPAKRTPEQDKRLGELESKHGIKEINRVVTEKKPKEDEKVKNIMNDIVSGKDKYFGYGHFDTSNMADYTLMSSTINDMVNVYGINEMQAADIIQSLTHEHRR